MGYKALKDIAKITMGQSPDSSSYNEEKDGLPFFQGNADFGELYPNERIWCNEPKKVAEPGDILISVRAPIGALNYAKDKCCIGRGLAAITIEDEAERNYVFHLLKARNNELNNKGTGSTFKAIGKSVLEEVSVPQISREEQQKCMDMMDLLESIIRERQAQLNKLDELIKARFVELFGDILTDKNLPLVQLNELADIGSSKRIYANEYVEEGVPFYRSKEIRELGSGLKPSVELFIKPERYDEIKAKYGVPKVGDILIAAIGATIGYSWIVNTDSPFYYKDGNLIILSIKKDVNPIFLNHTLGILIEDFKNKGASGSAQLALTIEKLEKMMVVNPDLELQNQFANFVKQVDKSKVAVQKSLDETQKLFDSLMQEYFG